MRWFHVEPTSGLPYTPPLDAANAAAAYSVRKLRTAYEGPCINISDTQSGIGSNKDVGFDSNGLVDVSEFYANSYISRFYDQSGNGLDLVGAGTSQPIISLVGVPEMLNGLVGIRFNGTSHSLNIPSSTAAFKFLHDGTKSSVYAVAEFGTSAEAVQALLGNSGGTAEVGILLDRVTASAAARSSVFRGVGGTTAVSNTGPSSQIPINTQALMVNEFDADNATAADRALGQVNGNATYQNNTQTNAPSAANANRLMTMGRFASANQFHLNGFVQETIIYDTDQSANRDTIRANINSYFSIY